jgi:hypothetical protein
MRPLTVIVSMSIALLLPASLFAQTIGPGTIEVTGYGGWGFGWPDLLGDVEASLEDAGLDPSEYSITDSSDNKLNVGGGVGIGIRENLLGRVDVVRSNLISVDIDAMGEPVSFGLNVLDITGGIEYLLPYEGSIVPFVGAGIGIARLSADISAAGASLSISDSDISYNAGGGARFGLNEKFGIRASVQVVHVPEQTFGRALFGLYYAIGRTGN